VAGWPWLACLAAGCQAGRVCGGVEVLGGAGLSCALLGIAEFGNGFGEGSEADQHPDGVSQRSWVRKA
jgi:hypothetical protein